MLILNAQTKTNFINNFPLELNTKSKEENHFLGTDSTQM